MSSFYTTEKFLQNFQSFTTPYIFLIILELNKIIPSLIRQNACYIRPIFIYFPLKFSKFVKLFTVISLLVRDFFTFAWVNSLPQP